MRPDRPLIGAVVTLAAGVTTILAYCQGTTAFSAGYPFSGSQLHVDFTTVGPAVVGGMALIALGLFLLAWALLAAFVSQIVRLSGVPTGGFSSAQAPLLMRFARTAPQ
jgi:hypothetical protein